MGAKDEPWGIPPVTAALVTLLSAVFLAQRLSLPADCLGAEYPALCGAAALLRATAPFGFLVAPLLHGSWVHLASNGAMIVVFGAVFERARGRAEYLLFLFIAAFLTADAQLFGELAAGRSVPAVVGASGIGYGLAGFAAVYYPLVRRTGDAEEGAAGRLRGVMRAGIVAAALFVVAYAVLTSVTPASAERSARLAHLVGLAAGIAWGVAAGRPRRGLP